jgi:UDP-N-acetylmuramoyl-L-alanyl-D-glutamate--2,6-diaminopimelate ligase
MTPPRFPPPPAWASALPTLGVTGTNGKTTTTAWAAAALRAGTGAPVVRATTVGVFLDDELLDVPPTYDGFLAAMRATLDRGGRAAAIELTSEALAVGFATAWPVRVGVFTNLTHDHLDAHGTPEHYLASKAQLFVHLPPGGAAVLNGCDPASALLAEVLPEGVRVLRYGTPSRGEPLAPLDLEATRVETSWRGTRVELRAAEGDFPAEIAVRAIGEVYAENALAALLGAVASGVPARVAEEAIAAAPPPPGRFEVVGERPYLVVDYAHSPDSLGRAVVAAKRLCQGRVTVVFGAGGDRDRKKREPMGAAAAAADRVIVTSDNPRREDPAAIAREIRAGLAGHADVATILDRGEAIAAAVEAAGPDDVVLVAGRGHETEQIFADGPRPFSDVEVLKRLAAKGR